MATFIYTINTSRLVPSSVSICMTCADPGASPRFARVDYARGIVTIDKPPRLPRPRPNTTSARRRLLAHRRGRAPIPVTTRAPSRNRGSFPALPAEGNSRPAVALAGGYGICQLACRSMSI